MFQIFKSKGSKMSGINTNLLRAIANATAAGTVVYLSQADALPLMQHQPPLIAVDSNQADPSDPNKRAARVTEAGVEYLNAQSQPVKHTSTFAVQSGIVLPKRQRKAGGGGGAPSKYPFETMGAGDFFFVANTDVDSGDAVKTMSSAVGSANQRFAEDVIENGEVKTKTVTRAKRDEKRRAIKGDDGKNVMETVTIPVKNFTRKFVVHPVEGGKVYGPFTAPADGAVVTRDK